LPTDCERKDAHDRVEEFFTRNLPDALRLGPEAVHAYPDNFPDSFRMVGKPEVTVAQNIGSSR
jgi:hypothetical protein